MHASVAILSNPLKAAMVDGVDELKLQRFSGQCGLNALHDSHVVGVESMALSVVDIRSESLCNGVTVVRQVADLANDVGGGRRPDCGSSISSFLQPARQHPLHAEAAIAKFPLSSPK